mmetsp:Transcript_19635/g.40665  ORF Transcript_19635/g.40665 Transcript_19635/m.40665 type:complete len:154 (-) Transcript_19635:355-816(-)
MCSFRIVFSNFLTTKHDALSGHFRFFENMRIILPCIIVTHIATSTLSYNASPSSMVANRVKSVNYFISRECNYKCKFCFHTQKNTHKLGLGKAKLGLQLLQHSGTEKINFAGGEPFLNPELLGELCKYARQDCGMAVSIISNGSLIKPDCELQ